jgi:hypothetical protein
MGTPATWLYGLALVLVLNIVAWLFSSPAVRKFRLPLMFAAYVILIVLSFKLGGWPVLALWWGVGYMAGLLRWSDDFRSARDGKDADVKPPSLVTLVHGLFTWPLLAPLILSGAFAWFVIDGLGSLGYSVYRKLLPNRVPHYKGIEVCRKAAISGDARAQLTLSSAYADGEYGLPQDYVESAKWCRKAAEQNHYAAQLRLGICLAEGKGVEKNLVEGLMWIFLSHHVATKHGTGHLFRDAAYQASARTKAQMTEQQIAEAWAMLDSSPLYKEFKERLDHRKQEVDRSASQPASEKSPPTQL